MADDARLWSVLVIELKCGRLLPRGEQQHFSADAADRRLANWSMDVDTARGERLVWAVESADIDTIARRKASGRITAEYPTSQLSQSTVLRS